MKKDDEIDQKCDRAVSREAPTKCAPVEKLYIYMRGAAGMMAGTHPISRIPKLAVLMVELTTLAAQERDAPPSLTFYKSEH